MAKSKADLFPPEEIALAGFAKCLAHPARVAIVTFLRENREASCGQIVEALPLAQPTVSQHLKALLSGGLLLARESGPMIFYSLNQARIQNFCTIFRDSISGPASALAPEAAPAASQLVAS
ncbi:MAG: ArsR/SmtB family transcription factor [Opitutales bacterium]